MEMFQTHPAGRPPMGQNQNMVEGPHISSGLGMLREVSLGDTCTRLPPHIAHRIAPLLPPTLCTIPPPSLASSPATQRPACAKNEMTTAAPVRGCFAPRLCEVRLYVLVCVRGETQWVTLFYWVKLILMD